MKKPKTLTKDQIAGYKKNGYLTVGQLKKFLKTYEIPDDAMVLIERVEDKYYLKHNWSVYEKPSEHTHWMMCHNDRMDSGYYEDRENFPDPHIIHTTKYTQEDIDASKTQYHPAWSPVLYTEDQDDFLFINLHY